MDDTHLIKLNINDLFKNLNDTKQEENATALAQVAQVAGAVPIATAKTILVEDEDEGHKFLSQLQLCSSCRSERAVVICSVCNELSKVDLFASNHQISSLLNDVNNNEKLCEQSATTNEIYFTKNSNEMTNEKTMPQSSHDLDFLMRSKFIYLKFEKVI